MNNNYTYKFISSTKYKLGKILTINSINYKPHEDYTMKDLNFENIISICEDINYIYVIGYRKLLTIICCNKINNKIIWSQQANIILENNLLHSCIYNGQIYLVGNIISNDNTFDFNNNNIKLDKNTTFLCCITYGTQKLFKLLDYYTNLNIIVDDYIYFCGFFNKSIIVKKIDKMGNIIWINKINGIKNCELKLTQSDDNIYIGGTIFLEKGKTNIIGFNKEIIKIKPSSVYNINHSFILFSCLKKYKGNGWIKIAGDSGCSNICTDICYNKNYIYLAGIIQNNGLDYTIGFNNNIVNLDKNPYNIFIARISIDRNIVNDWMNICSGSYNNEHTNLFPKISCINNTIYITGYIINQPNNIICDSPLTKIFIACMLSNGKQLWFKTCGYVNIDKNSKLSIYATYNKVYVIGIFTSALESIVDFSNNCHDIIKNKTYRWVTCLHKNENVLGEWFIINEIYNMKILLSNFNKNTKINIIGYNSNLYIYNIYHLIESVIVYGVVTNCELYNNIKHSHIPEYLREYQPYKYKITTVCKGKLRLNKCFFRKGRKCYYDIKNDKIVDFSIMYCSDYIYLGIAIDDHTIHLDIGKKYVKIDQLIESNTIYYWDKINKKYMVNDNDDIMGVSINSNTLLIL
jgi:hypothetical protein